MKKKAVFFLFILLTILFMVGCPGGGQQSPNQTPISEIEPEPTVEIKPVQLFIFPGDWKNVTPVTIDLFYPGQVSWQWLVSEEHRGSEGVLKGTSCRTCHSGQETKLGQTLVDSGPLEEDPIIGKLPTITTEVRAAYDDDFFYIRYQWESESPGVTHTLWRYDGAEWVSWGGSKPEVLKASRPASYEDRISMIIDDKDIPAYQDAQIGFAGAGCFITCHASLRHMPLQPSKEEVQNDLSKYLLITRTEIDNAGAWNKPKPEGDIEQLKKSGMFLDLWQWRAARSNPVGYASDDYILEYRLSDQGTGPFTTPAQPQWMYNKDTKGFKAIPEAELDQHLEKFPLIIDDPENAVEYDPQAEFQQGDLLPQPVLRQPEGSAADIQANGHYKNGVWTVELRRKLDTGNDDDKKMIDGKIYNIGIGLFDDHTSDRRHYVSFEHTLGLGVEGDISAVKIK